MIEDEDTPTTTIEDEDTPKTALNIREKSTPKTKKTTILDEDVPLSDAAPETGDTTNLLIPVVGMGLSVLVIVMVFLLRKKRN